MRFHVVLESAPEGGFTAQCVEIPGAISEGETRKEALANVQDAIRRVREVCLVQAQTFVGQERTESRRLELVELTLKMAPPSDDSPI